MSEKILQEMLSNGAWINCGERTEELLLRCERVKGISREELIQTLISGKKVRNAPGNWYSYCRYKPAERPPAIEEKVIEKRGQLWEPCGCGREPVYMPLHLCDRCWPEG